MTDVIGLCRSILLFQSQVESAGSGSQQVEGQLPDKHGAYPSYIKGTTISICRRIPMSTRTLGAVPLCALTVDAAMPHGLPGPHPAPMYHIAIPTKGAASTSASLRPSGTGVSFVACGCHFVYVHSRRNLPRKTCGHGARLYRVTWKFIILRSVVFCNPKDDEHYTSTYPQFRCTGARSQ